MEKISKDIIIDLSLNITPESANGDYIVEIPTKGGNITHRSLNPCSILNLHVVKDMVINNMSKNSIFLEPYPEIDNLDDLLLYLTDVLIHFDTDPDVYIKNDYRILISTLTKSLIYLYKTTKDSEEQNKKQTQQIEEILQILTQLQTKLDNHQALLDTKVDKEEGKGLSEQNFTQAEKDKLAGLFNYDDTALQLKVQAEIDRAVAKDAKLAKDISDETYRALGSEAALSERIDTVSAIVSTIPDSIAQAKQEAILTAAYDATEKANIALADANTYTDNKLKSLTGALIYKGSFEELPSVDSYSNGNVIIVKTKEYVLTEEDNIKTWVEIGDETAWDTLGSAAEALNSAKEYADSLSVNYDSIGSAALSLLDAKDYTDKRIVAQIIRY